MAPRIRKTARSAKQQPQTQNDLGIEPENETEDLDLDLISEDDPQFKGIPRSADIQVRSWLERKNFLEQSFECLLYYVNPNNTNDREYLDRYTDHIPSEHEIGIKHGAGKYLVVIQVVDKTGKRFGTTSTVKINKRYDVLRDQALIAPVPQMPVPGGMYGMNQGNSGMEQALTIMQSMVAMLIPLIRPHEPDQNVSQMMADSFKTMNQLMKTTTLDNMQFLNDVVRRNADLPETVESEGESTGFMNILNTLLPMIESVLPAIQSRGAASQAAVSQIKNMPGYNQVIKDARVIKGLVDFITNKHGENVAVEVCKKFGIKKPRKRGEK